MRRPGPQEFAEHHRQVLVRRGRLLVVAVPPPDLAGADADGTAADDGAALDRRDIETQYCVEYHVPWALFAKYHGVAAPEAGARWRGNFYKCGDDTGRPHWGTWAPVGTNRPNFHRPSDFQVLTFA